MDQSGDFIKRLECLMNRAKQEKQWGMVVYYQVMLEGIKKPLQIIKEAEI